jgi:hypothetical protein
VLGTNLGRQSNFGVGEPYVHLNISAGVSPTSDRVALTGLHRRARLAQRRHLAVDAGVVPFL